MNSTHVFLVALACIVCGTLLTALHPGDVMGVSMITAGTGQLVVAGAMQKNKERKLKKDYDEAVEETQTLRRELFKKSEPDTK